tara:strand:- start:441 stop:689 length:249 start_codon:yes stop_codon:yes gene_type:complete
LDFLAFRVDEDNTEKEGEEIDMRWAWQYLEEGVESGPVCRSGVEVDLEVHMHRGIDLIKINSHLLVPRHPNYTVFCSKKELS